MDKKYIERNCWQFSSRLSKKVSRQSQEVEIMQIEERSMPNMNFWALSLEFINRSVLANLINVHDRNAQAESRQSTPKVSDIESVL